MVFSSLSFLMLFLPAVLIVYFAVPKRARNAVLFVFSLLFYAWGEPIYVVLMIFSTILDYICGRCVERFRGTPKAKIGLIISLCGNLGLLMFFKYFDFFIGTLNALFGWNIPQHDLPLPIGISFYTFQTMSYTIDVYKGKAKAQRNIITFGAYVSLFPQLIAGPIVRYSDIAEQLENRVCTFDKFGEGAKRFVIGLGKKVLLANNIGALWKTISEMTNGTVLSAWLGIAAFAFQIYFDFTGYSDMAIGLGRMLGFDFPENFNYPYISKSATEFWQRWHISMGTWFRDYVYIPLGGNRRGLPIQMRNIIIVWFLTGLWHGANWNYVLWGAFFAVVLVIEKLFLLKVLKKIPKIFRFLYTAFVLSISWVLFAFEDIGKGWSFFGQMFGGVEFVDRNTLYLLLSYLPLMMICVIASTPYPKIAFNKISEKFKKAETAAEPVCAACVMALSMAYLISGSYNPFLYFRF